MNYIKVCVCSFVFIFIFPYLAYAKPKVEDVTLKEFTKLTVYIPVGMGVKFTLPFILNESDSAIPFSKIITNPSFKSFPKFGSKNLAPVNYFTVMLDPNKKSDANKLAIKRGNLFFNISGYQVTIELIATNSHKRHISDYNFVLGVKEKEVIIQSLVKQRSKGLDNQYEYKVSQNNKEIDRQSLLRLSHIMKAGLEYYSVKEKQRVVTSNGDKITLSIEDVITAGKYTVVPFIIESVLQSSDKGVIISAAKLFTINENSPNLIPVDGVFDYPKRIDSGQEVKGTFIFISPQIKKNYILKLMVGNKIMEIKW